MILMNEDVQRDITKAYCGGEGSTNSFSRFGKRRKKAEEVKKGDEKSREEDGEETD